MSSEVPVGVLEELASLGCRVELRIEEGALRIAATAERSKLWVIDATGTWSDGAPTPEDAAAAEDAARRHDVAEVLQHMADLTTSVSITVLHDDGVPWVRRADAALRVLSDSGWLQFATLLRAAQGHLVVVDAGEEVFRSPALAVHGPTAWPETPTLSDAASASASADDPRSEMPAPDSFMPDAAIEGSLSDLADALTAVSGSLAWAWLADEVVVKDRSVSVHVVSARPVRGELALCPVAFAEPAVELWKWASTSSEPGRRHAITQAAALQVDVPDDLFARSASIHETAQFLYSVAQSDLIREALSSRRSARDAAIAAGRAAGDRARSASRSALDRVMVLVAGGVGVVLANRSDVIDRGVAVGLIVLVGLVTCSALLLAFHFDLPGAHRSVSTFRKELGGNTEVLSPGDISEISKLPSLVAGEDEVRSARSVSIAISIATFAALVVLGVLVFSLDGNDTSPDPASPPTSVSPQSPPSTSTSTSRPPSPSTSAQAGP